MKLFLFALITLGAAMPAAAQDPLSAARELYASADYEQALEKLGGLRTPETAAPVLEQVDQYRAFCLFALGRTADAQAVAESLVRKNPMLELDATDASPRLSAMFTDVRRRLLPALVRDRYRQARASLDSKNFTSAEPQLIEVRVMISDAEKINAMDEGMADLRVLVDGFIDLTRSLRENAAEQQAREEAAADGKNCEGRGAGGPGSDAYWRQQPGQRHRTSGAPAGSAAGSAVVAADVQVRCHGGSARRADRRVGKRRRGDDPAVDAAGLRRDRVARRQDVEIPAGPERDDAGQVCEDSGSGRSEVAADRTEVRSGSKSAALGDGQDVSLETL